MLLPFLNTQDLVQRYIKSLKIIEANKKTQISSTEKEIQKAFKEQFSILIKTKNDSTASKNILSSKNIIKMYKEHRANLRMYKTTQKRKLAASSPICSRCNKEEETTFHLFATCEKNIPFITTFKINIKQISKNKFSFSDLWKNTSSSPTPPEDQLIFWLMAGYIPNGIHNITQTKSKKNITKNKLLSLIITEVNILTRNILKEKKMSDKLQLTELMHEIFLEDQIQALQPQEQIQNAENANENNFLNHIISEENDDEDSEGEHDSDDPPIETLPALISHI